MFSLSRTLLAGSWLLAGMAFGAEETAATSTAVQLSAFPPAQTAPETADVAGVRIALPYGKNRRLAGMDLGFVNQLTEGAAGLQIAGIANVAGKGDVTGLQIALINLDDFTIFPQKQLYSVQGMQLGLVNYAGGDLSGFQVGGVFNFVLRDFRGLQIGGLGNLVQSGDAYGLQCSLFNNVRREDLELAKAGSRLRLRTMAGMQLAALYNRNDEGTMMRGLQVATVNLTGSLRGTQIGLWNKSGYARGVQIGVVNIAKELHGLQLGLVNINRNAQVPFVPVMSIAF